VSTVRVLVADRSATVRGLLRRLLDEDVEITVVGEVGDGREALDLVREQAPDAVVLDLDLPSLEGGALVEAIGAQGQIPMVVLTPRQHRDRLRTAFASLNRGVVAVFPKPEVPDGWAELGRLLRESVRHLGGQRSTERPTSGSSTGAAPCLTRALRYLAIGASTGGPGALFDLLGALGRHPRVGVVVVQHIAEGFESGLAEWLGLELGIDVAIARTGDHLGKGCVRIAPAGGHLTLDRFGILQVDRQTPAVNGHRPSVEVLFRSLADHPPERVAAVLLSGMGADGADGMLALRREGCLTVAQDEASSAVFGMPRAALDRGAAVVTLPPNEIGHLVARVTEANG